MTLQLSEKKEKKTASLSRNINLDLIRCAAIISVIAVHFFLNTGFYLRDVEGKTMMAMTVLKTVSMICVPLFVLLTGYLNSHKKLSTAYFKKLCPVLLSYLLCCVLVLLHRVVVRKEDLSIMDGLLQTLQISDGAISYAWYIEMYIGLFLLIPFLNAMYMGLENQKNKQLLLLVMAILTMIPNGANIYNFLSLDFWKAPSSVTVYHSIFPDSWTSLWPITYYFIGAYIREYDIGISVKQNLLALAGAILLSSGYNIYRSFGSVFFQPFGPNWGGIQNTVQSVLAFLLLLHLDVSRWPKWIHFLIHRISKISLLIYLCSILSDWKVYGIFHGLELELPMQLLCAPVFILASFTLAALLAQLVSWIQGGLIWLINRTKKVKV